MTFYWAGCCRAESGPVGRKLTQENVRFDTDLNIARIESWRHSISLTTIADLCDYYKISPADLFRNIATHP